MKNRFCSSCLLIVAVRLCAGAGLNQSNICRLVSNHSISIVSEYNSSSWNWDYAVRFNYELQSISFLMLDPTEIDIIDMSSPRLKNCAKGLNHQQLLEFSIPDPMKPGFRRIVPRVPDGFCLIPDHKYHPSFGPLVICYTESYDAPLISPDESCKENCSDAGNIQIKKSSLACETCELFNAQLGSEIPSHAEYARVQLLHFQLFAYNGNSALLGFRLILPTKEANVGLENGLSVDLKLEAVRIRGLGIRCTKLTALPDFSQRQVSYHHITEDYGKLRLVILTDLDPCLSYRVRGFVLGEVDYFLGVTAHPQELSAFGIKSPVVLMDPSSLVIE